jgi:hypothetical protein
MGAEERRDERGPACDPTPAGGAVLACPGGLRQAGIQAVVLDLAVYLRPALPGQPVIEVLVHLRAPFLCGRVRPGSIVTIASRQAPAHRADVPFVSSTDCVARHFLEPSKGEVPRIPHKRSSRCIPSARLLDIALYALRIE